MIKIALYHSLFEIAIDTLFTAISNNFSTSNKLVVGSVCKSIRIIRTSNAGLAYYETYDDCVITHIYNGKYAGNNVTLFNFTCKGGDIIMGCSLFDSIIN